MFEAKTTLPGPVRKFEPGKVCEIVIARAGRTVARRVPLDDRSRRTGVAHWRFEVPEPDPASDAAVSRLFEAAGTGTTDCCWIPTSRCGQSPTARGRRRRRVTPSSTPTWSTSAPWCCWLEATRPADAASPGSAAAAAHDFGRFAAPVAGHALIASEPGTDAASIDAPMLTARICAPARPSEFRGRDPYLPPDPVRVQDSRTCTSVPTQRRHARRSHGPVSRSGAVSTIFTEQPCPTASAPTAGDDFLLGQ